MSLCGEAFGNPDWPDAGEGTCCAGAAMFGPHRCTCWTPVYDLEQRPIRPDLVGWLAAGVHPDTRPRMCEGCAYRPDSPERRGDPRHVGDADELERIAAESRFWCHVGIRRITGYVHPSGARAPGHPAAYDPPTLGAVPFCADGAPAQLCAGWAARRRAITGRHHLDDTTPPAAPHGGPDTDGGAPMPPPADRHPTHDPAVSPPGLR